MFVMLRKRKESLRVIAMNDKDNVIIAAFGLIPVCWCALLIAPFLDGGLVEIMEGFPDALASPFSISICEDSMKAILILVVAYLMGIGVYVSTRRNYRRGAEHGSAKWGDPFRLNKKYKAKSDSDNKILTQNVKIGLDARKHRRNLNVLVCGGSGAGKTRFYCKPNLMQANTSLVVLDPKGQLKYARALNLPLKFTYFRERRWQKWLNLRLYGILPSTSDSLKMMNLKVNLTAFPIRKST